MPRNFLERRHRRVHVERHVQTAQVDRAGQELGGLVGFGADREGADDDPRSFFAPGLEMLAVVAAYRIAAARIDEVREREGQAELRGERAAELRGTEEPELGCAFDLGLK